MIKRCPECKSPNTRQMDETLKKQSAYCLSCYHVFKSILKPQPIEKQISKKYSEETARYIQKAIVDIKGIKSKISIIEKRLEEICNQQDSTEVR